MITRGTRKSKHADWIHHMVFSVYTGNCIARIVSTFQSRDLFFCIVLTHILSISWMRLLDWAFMFLLQRQLCEEIFFLWQTLYYWSSLVVGRSINFFLISNSAGVLLVTEDEWFFSFLIYHFMEKNYTKCMMHDLFKDHYVLKIKWMIHCVWLSFLFLLFNLSFHSILNILMTRRK